MKRVSCSVLRCLLEKKGAYTLCQRKNRLQKMLAAIIIVTSPRWLVLRVMPKKTTRWYIKKA